MTRCARTVTAFVGAVLILYTRVAGAQRPEDVKYGPPLIVAVVEAIQYPGADAVIVRRASTIPHDVLLVKRGRVTRALLVEGVTLMSSLRRRSGDTPVRDEVFRVKESSGARRSLRGPSLERQSGLWLEMLAELRPKPLDGYGEVPYLAIGIPTKGITAPVR